MSADEGFSLELRLLTIKADTARKVLKYRITSAVSVGLVFAAQLVFFIVIAPLPPNHAAQALQFVSVAIVFELFMIEARRLLGAVRLHRTRQQELANYTEGAS